MEMEERTGGERKLFWSFRGNRKGREGKERTGKERQRKKREERNGGERKLSLTFRGKRKGMEGKARTGRERQRKDSIFCKKDVPLCCNTHEMHIAIFLFRWLCPYAVKIAKHY